MRIHSQKGELANCCSVQGEHAQSLGILCIFFTLRQVRGPGYSKIGTCLFLTPIFLPASPCSTSNGSATRPLCLLWTTFMSLHYIITTSYIPVTIITHSSQSARVNDTRSIPIFLELCKHWKYVAWYFRSYLFMLRYCVYY